MSELVAHVCADHDPAVQEQLLRAFEVAGPGQRAIPETPHGLRVLLGITTSGATWERAVDALAARPGAKLHGCLEFAAKQAKERQDGALAGFDPTEFERGIG